MTKNLPESENKTLSYQDMPHSDDMNASAQPLSDYVPLSHYNMLQQEYLRALESLRLFAEGVRLITRQMKQHHNDDNDSVPSSSSTDANLPRDRTLSNCTVSSFCSAISDDDSKRINEVSCCLEWGTRKELLDLSEAAQVVNEHSRMVTHEAILLTQDVTLAGRTTQMALERASKSERAAKRLLRENVKLESKMEQMLVERKVLAREIKSLRKENTEFIEDSKRLEAMEALENHVRAALIIHEKQLAASANGKISQRSDQSKDYSVYDQEVNSDKRNIETQRGECLESEIVSCNLKGVQVDSSRAFQPSVGFGGAGLAGLGYKFKKQKQPLSTSMVCNSPSKNARMTNEDSLETETTAAHTAPAKTLSTVSTNKENIKSAISVGGKRIMEEFSSSLSNFWCSQVQKVPYPTMQDSNKPIDIERDLMLEIDRGNCIPFSIHAEAPTLLSPFSDNSVASTSLDLLHNSLLSFDEGVQRCLALPDEDASTGALHTHISKRSSKD
jgi:hypothetical protein